MVDYCALTLDVLDPEGEPVTNGAIGVMPWKTAFIPEGVVVGAEKFYALSYRGGQHNVEHFVRGVVYRWREYKPKGRTFWAYCPDAPTADYSDLVEVDPATLNPVVAPEAAWWLAFNAETGRTTELEETVGTDWLEEKTIALRKWIIALKGAQTAAVDIVVTPSDSLGESANVTSAANRWTQVLVQKLRAVYNPDGVKGGYGYYGAGSNVLLPGDPPFTGSGTIAAGNDSGLGLKNAVLSPAAQYIWGTEFTTVDTFFTTGPTHGTYRVRSSLGPGVEEQDSVGTTAAGATGHVKVTQTGKPGNYRYVTVENTDGAKPLKHEGGFFYHGDETTGVRMWEGGRASYSAQNYVAVQEWAKSLALIPNPQLLIIPIGSNDFYYGQSPAATKARLQTIIALARANMVTDPSIVLVGYYDRDAPAKVADWAAFTAMYRQVAAADPKVTFLDMVPTFGPWVGGSDTRGGLTDPVDFVHFTNAGAQLFADAVFDFVVPAGASRGGAPTVVTKASLGLGSVDNTADLGKPISFPQLALVGDQAPLFAASPFSGPISLSGFAASSYGVYRLGLNGNVTFDGANGPTIGSMRSFTYFLELVQDATGGRTLTVTNVVMPDGPPVLSTSPFAVDYIELRQIGTETVLVGFVRGDGRPTTVYRAYTVPGAAVWTKPVGLKAVEVIAVGGGAGGGSGRRGAAGTVRGGGGGGGGAGINRRVIEASILASTEPITVGVGGAGGAAVTANDTNGNAGSGGTASTFGAAARALVGAPASGQGAGGSTAGGAAGNGGWVGGTGGGVGAAAAPAVAAAGNSSTGGGGGGGGGGGISAADALQAAAGGAPNMWMDGNGASAAVGGPARSATPQAPGGGTGGPGGPASITAAATAGGAGGAYGGGGGGGGASLNGFASGAGGKGGDGIVVIIEHY